MLPESITKTANGAACKKKRSDSSVFKIGCLRLSIEDLHLGYGKWVFQITDDWVLMDQWRNHQVRELYRCGTTRGQNIQKPWALKLGKVKHWIRGTISFFASHSWPVILGHSFQMKTVTSTYCLHFWNFTGLCLLKSPLCLSQTPVTSQQLSWSFTFLLQAKMQLNWEVLALLFSKEILFQSQQLVSTLYFVSIT